MRDQVILNLDEAPVAAVKRLRSFKDKMADVTVLEDGSVTHNVLKVKEDGRPRAYKNEDTFKRWLLKHQREYKDDLKKRLNPNQVYITQGVGTERPFTGQYWWTKDVGIYACVCCS